MARLLDLLALLIVAFLLLLPQPTVTFSPGFVGDKSDLDRIAVLEDALFRKPGDVEPAIELARAYLRVEQPSWAIATLAPHATKDNYLVHQVLATAYATVLRFDLGLAQAEAGLKACDTQNCPDVTRIRLEYLAGLMRENAQKGTDPNTDPIAAKQRVRAALRATRAQPPTTPPAPPAKKP